MNQAKTIHWQPVSMISTFVEMTQGMLESTETQLTNLQRAKIKPYVLDDDILNRVVKVHTDQKKFLSLYLEQCRIWQMQNLNDQQKKLINTIEANIKLLEALNQQILSLAKQCEKSTIDKILDKDDIELALNVLSGKMDFPRI